MNIEKEKKEYIAPAMTVVEMKLSSQLLESSCESGCAESDSPENPWDFN